MRGYRPDLSPAKAEYVKALDLIKNAKRPLILAGHGILVSGAEMEVQMFAERPSGHDAVRARRIASIAPAESRHDGNARRSLGQHRHPGSRLTLSFWHAL